MSPLFESIRSQALRAQEAAIGLSRLASAQRDGLLHGIARRLREQLVEIQAANQLDLERGREEGLSAAMLDRLSLQGERVEAMALGLEAIARLPDPLGEVVAGWRRPNGLQIEQVRVPLGVVGFIYEARPNVTVEAAGLCLKSGNALILRGGTSAWESNRILVAVMRAAIAESGMASDCVVGLLEREREAIDVLLGLRGIVDVVIPRGGAALIARVVETAKVPVIETGVGNCHVYVDQSADFAMARAIILNAKGSRPGVCNAAETLLVHAARARDWLPEALSELVAADIEIRGDATVVEVFPGASLASEEDWGTEYLDRILAVRVVAGLDEALAHIRRWGTHHSEAIVTNDLAHAERFLNEIDAAAVYVNASTRFTDGGEFGFGAEVGISTQKLHARGPMGLRELTTTQYRIRGQGQIR